MKFKILGAMTAFFLMSSCSTIHFDNGPVNPAAPQAFSGEDWHHDGLLALVEFSDPVNLEKMCTPGTRWDSIQVEQNVWQAIITGVTFTLYAPWDVAYSCTRDANSSMPRMKQRKKRKRKG